VPLCQPYVCDTVNTSRRRVLGTGHTSRTVADALVWHIVERLIYRQLSLVKAYRPVRWHRWRIWPPLSGMFRRVCSNNQLTTRGTASAGRCPLAHPQLAKLIPGEVLTFPADTLMEPVITI
jgi:hypothetical protein